MMRISPAGLAFALLALMSAGHVMAQDKKPGPLGRPDGPARMQQHWTGNLLLLRTCRPPGDAPAPVAVINHGSPRNAGDRATRQPSACTSAPAEWFLKRGYVVAFPLRRGYGATGGKWAENYGTCQKPNFVRAGNATADDIEDAIAYVAKLPYADPARILVVGQSAGGWGTVALGARNRKSVWGLINFAGGRAGWAEKKPNTNCAPDMLAAAAGRYGSRARLPALWVYAENDTYFTPAIIRAMHNAYSAAGAPVDFHLLGPQGKDGHNLFFSDGGAKVWGPLVEKYIATLPR